METKGTLVSHPQQIHAHPCQALKGREKWYRHATEERPERLPGDIVSYEVNKGCMQPGRIVGLDGAGSVLQNLLDVNVLLRSGWARLLGEQWIRRTLVLLVGEGEGGGKVSHAQVRARRIAGPHTDASACACI